MDVVLGCDMLGLVFKTMSNYGKLFRLFESLNGVEIAGETKGKFLSEDFETQPEENTGPQVAELTPQFHNWFGRSVVVDGGQPLVCYHGSQAKFDHFDLDAKKINRTNNVQGIYFFGTKPGGSNIYTGDSGQLYPCYLKIEKPFYEGRTRFPYESKSLAREITQRITKDYGYVESKMQRMENGNFPDTLDGNQRRDVLLAGGFDGFIDGSFQYGEICVLNPLNIKSIYNDGSWDANDPSIYS